MSYLSMEFMRKVEMGLVDGWTFERKFGRSASITTTMAPIAMSNNYPTPTALTTVEILSDNVNDTLAGTGAQKVKVYGLTTAWALTSEIVDMNGTTAVTLANQYFRIFRAYVYQSGKYASSTVSSHAGTITLRNAADASTWFQITSDGGIGLGQTLIAAYTIPAGYTGYVYLSYIAVEATKAATFFFFTREGADDVTTPYEPMRIRSIFDSSSAFIDFNGSHYLFEAPEMTDIGFMAKTSSGTAYGSCEFKIYLKAN